MKIRLLVVAMVSMSVVSVGWAPVGAGERAATAPTRAAVKVIPIATGLNGPSGFTFSPNGKIWYLERGTGEVRILDPVTKQDHLFFGIAWVNGSG